MSDSASTSRRGLFGLLPADTSPERWHVSPTVDRLAYHWSWLWVLLPMLMLGNRPRDYMWITIPILALNFAHRHLTLPIVYLDPQTLRRFPVRFAVTPLLVLVAFLVPAVVGPEAFRDNAYMLIASVSAVWGLWHVLQQKYGMLRLYNAKSGVPLEQRAPPWVDRWLVNGWVPAWVLYGATMYPKRVMREMSHTEGLVAPILAWAPTIAPLLLPFALIGAAIPVALFLRYEWQTTRLGNPARLGMGLGITALSASLFVVDPIKVALAYTFTHGLEYCVFVWAYERRRFAIPNEEPLPIEQASRRPVLFYGGFVVLAMLTFLFAKHYGHAFFVEQPHPEPFGMRMSKWLALWGVSQAMLHYYYDGFLWKMRHKTTRGNL